MVTKKFTENPRPHGSSAEFKIAVPNKGRLCDPSLALLRRLGLDFEDHERKLSAQVYNFPAELLFVNAKNIPEYIQDGVVDVGITGIDIVREQDCRVEMIEPLGFGHTDLVVAVPTHSEYRTLESLEGKRIATVFPKLTAAFFKERGIKVELVKVSGAVEITPQIGLADAICDLTSSGSTLRVNDLRPIDTVLESQAVLIGSSEPRPEIAAAKSSFIVRVGSVLLAERKRYLMLNAPSSLLPEIKKVAPGLQSPTVMNLAQEGMIAVHTVIDAAGAWEVVEELKKIGATGILIMPIERMTP
jgi:ATP phosphoribosyltransferase